MHVVYFINKKTVRTVLYYIVYVIYKPWLGDVYDGIPPAVEQVYVGGIST